MSTYSESPLSRLTRSFFDLRELDLDRDRLKMTFFIKELQRVEKREIQGEETRRRPETTSSTHLLSLLLERCLCPCLCRCLSRSLLPLLRLLCLSLSRSRSRLRSRWCLRSRLRLRLRRRCASRSRSRLRSSTSRRPKPEVSFFSGLTAPLAISSILASLFSARRTSIVFSNSARFSLILMKPKCNFPPK